MDWTRVIDAFERSGLPQARFVAERGLKLSTFRYHLYRQRQKRTEAPQPEPLRFVELAVRQPPPPVLMEAPILELGRLRLQLPPTTSPEQLAALVVALQKAGAC